jgi:hypothetical protein
MIFYIIHTLMALAEIHMLTILPNDMRQSKHLEVSLQGHPIKRENIENLKSRAGYQATSTTWGVEAGVWKGMESSLGSGYIPDS